MNIEPVADSFLSSCEKHGPANFLLSEHDDSVMLLCEA